MLIKFSFISRPSLKPPAKLPTTVAMHCIDTIGPHCQQRLWLCTGQHTFCLTSALVLTVTTGEACTLEFLHIRVAVNCIQCFCHECKMCSCYQVIQLLYDAASFYTFYAPASHVGEAGIIFSCMCPYVSMFLSVRPTRILKNYSSEIDVAWYE